MRKSFLRYVLSTAIGFFIIYFILMLALDWTDVKDNIGSLFFQSASTAILVGVIFGLWQYHSLSGIGIDLSESESWHGNFSDKIILNQEFESLYSFLKSNLSFKNDIKFLSDSEIHLSWGFYMTGGEIFIERISTDQIALNAGPKSHILKPDVVQIFKRYEAVRKLLRQTEQSP